MVRSDLPCLCSGQVELRSILGVFCEFASEISEAFLLKTLAKRQKLAKRRGLKTVTTKEFGLVFFFCA